MNAHDLKVARRYKALAQSACPGALLKLLVYGSRARGDQHAGSDLDLMVVVETDDLTVRRRLQELAWDVQVEFDFPYVVSPLVMTTDHFQRLVTLERRLAQDILTEGISI